MDQERGRDPHTPQHKDTDYGTITDITLSDLCNSFFFHLLNLAFMHICTSLLPNMSL
jgi:hypothetical protein